MTNSLNPREVLSYLNQLGYQNITAKQLKEFMKDLKKLIKYERKQTEAAAEAENVPPPQTNSLFLPTESSQAKQVTRKPNIISVQIKRPSTHTCSTQVECPESCPVSQGTSRLTTTEPSTLITSASPRWPKSCDIGSRGTKSQGNSRSNALRSKASYIIPRPPVKVFKSDPVALYHKYQQGWKMQKLPGEENHSELRWAIRERMLGQASSVMSAAPSMETVARRRKTSRI